MTSEQALSLARQCYIRRTCRVLDTPSIDAADKAWNGLASFERQRELAKLPESLARQLRRGPAQPHVSQLSACQ